MGLVQSRFKILFLSVVFYPRINAFISKRILAQDEISEPLDPKSLERRISPSGKVTVIRWAGEIDGFPNGEEENRKKEVENANCAVIGAL